MPGATPSQTIGPFFAGGLQWAIDATARAPFADPVQITGRVLDADEKGVADALLEIWQPHVANEAPSSKQALRGFQRVATDADGRFSFWMPRPHREQHHADVTIFARGLLRGLFTRVYVYRGNAPEFDIPHTVPRSRIDALISTEISPGVYRWDVRLRGARETVFFEL